MAESIRKFWLRTKTMGPDDLYDRAPGSRILLSSTAGYANQVRSAMAITAASLVPVIQDNAEYRARVLLEEGIDMTELFSGIEMEQRSDINARVYRDWIIAPWRDLNPSDAAEVFNALNYPGLVNASRLPFLPDMRGKLRDMFDGFAPRLSRSEVASRADKNMLAIHLRMFGRNYDTRYAPLKKGVNYGRHYSKEAWSASRLRSAVSTVTELSKPGSPIAVYTDRRDHPDALRFVELIEAAGFKPQFATLSHSGSLGAMEESMLLSGHRRMVLTSSSSFGHLGALLAEDLKTVVSV